MDVRASCINGLIPTVEENVETTMKKRKILFYISTLRSGGAARVMVNLSNAFAREGYAVTLVTNFSDIHEYLLGEGVKRICLEQEESKANTVLKNIRRCSGLRRAIKQEKPDVCVSFMRENNFRLLASSRFLRCRCYVSVRSDPKMEYFGRVNRLIMQTLFPFAKGCILQTKDALHWMPKRIQKKCQVIPNMVDERFFHAHRSNAPEGIISVGRLTDCKRHDLMLRAFAALCDTVQDDLYFYGDGEKLEELTALANQLGIADRVHFMGHVQDLVPVYEKAKLFLLASDLEGMPNALLEALACGVPCISTDCPCGGPKEVMEKRMGTLIPVGDLDALTEAMRDLLSDEEKRNSYSREAQNRMQAYRWDIVWQQWRDFIFSY